MELVSTTLNNLPIVILVSSVVLFVKETLFNFLSLDFVKQTLKTVFGLTPRETGELILTQAKHIAILLKTSLALVLPAIKHVLLLLSFLIPERVLFGLGVALNTTLEVFFNGSGGEVFADMFIKLVKGFFIGFGNLLKLFIHLIPQVFKFFEYVFSAIYRIGQVMYMILTSLNTVGDMARNTWNWVQDPPVNQRIIVASSILIFSILISFSLKCIGCLKKKIE